MKIIILSVLFSLIEVVLNSFLTLLLADSIKGNNYSDVGIPMYSNSQSTFVLCVFVFLIIAIVGYFLQKKIFTQKKSTIIYIITNVFVLLPLLWVLAWGLNI